MNLNADTSSKIVTDTDGRLRLPDPAREEYRMLLIDCPQNGGDIWNKYKFEFLTLEEENKYILMEIAVRCEAAGVKALAALSKTFLDQNAGKILEFLRDHEESGAALITLLGDSIFEQHHRFSSYVDKLSLQGGSTIENAISRTPPGWVPRDEDRLIQIREHFGASSSFLFDYLRENHPDGWCAELDSLEASSLGISALGLLIKNGTDASLLVEQRADLIGAIRSLCEIAKRPDAFIATTFFLTRELLDTCPNELMELARTNAGKLPDLLESLTGDLVRDHFPRILDIARYGRTRIVDAVRCLSKVSQDEGHLVESLILRCGVFSGNAIERRESALYRSDRARHEELIYKYGHAYWGLAEQFKGDLHREEAERRPFIEEARHLTSFGAGHFFAYLPREYWNEKGIEFARTYGNASGFILEQRGRATFEIESDPSYRDLVSLNREHFNIRWVNRYSRFVKQQLDTTLLQQNLANMSSSETDERALVVYIGAQTDPLNSLSCTPHYSLLSEIGSRARLFVAEAATVDEIEKIYKKICEDPRFGGSPSNPRKIDMGIIAAHSDGFALQLSGARHIPPATEEEARFTLNQQLSVDDGEAIAAWNRYYVQGGALMLYACSTLRPGLEAPPVGEVVQAKLPGLKVLGLEQVGNLHSFSLDERGLPNKLHWRDGYVWY